MRLLNTTSITTKEFVGQDIPPYAILSHTWEKGEVLLADIRNGTAPSKEGFAKILGCCTTAAEYGFDWVWIDTCCIDKTSSAELSEAINSMYRWYELSTICYVYLRDVSVAEGGALLSSIPLGHSRWFTRGWTLQELLAPRAVEFYSFDWKEIGTKSSLATSLSYHTGIPTRVLHGESPNSCSIAERMSWASSRQTTREEDMAYCLLGLFNVNMPLLYGEGQKAFIRLQEQILKQEEDYSLFAWTLQHDCGEMLTGFLASTPQEFSNLVPGHLQPPTVTDDPRQKETEEEEEEDTLMETEEDSLALARPRKQDDRQTFATRFGTIELRYNVLHDKKYREIQKYDIQSATAKYVPKQPPLVTSRGLLLTLPMIKSKDTALSVIAWVYCELDGQLLCVGLRPCAASSRLYGRQTAPWLITVDKSFLPSFTSEEVLLHPNGLVQQGGATETLSVSSAPSRSLGRLRILPREGPTCIISVVLAFPMNRWEMDEFFFQGAPEVIGIAIIECTSERGTSRFMISTGIHDERPWCALVEVPISEPSGDAILIEKFYHRLSNDKQQRSKLSDRAAVISRTLPETAVASAVRRVPQSQRNAHAYSLQVVIQKPRQGDSWTNQNDGLDRTVARLAPG